MEGRWSGASFGLVSDIEDVLERRGVSFPTAPEITQGEGM